MYWITTISHVFEEDEAKEEASKKIHQDEPCELESSLGARHEVKPCTDADDQKNDTLQDTDVTYDPW